MELPFNPEIPLLGILRILKKQYKKYIHPYVHSVTIYSSQIWKQPKCPSVGEWIKKLWYIYTMDYYIAIKKEETLTFCNSMDGPGDYYAK